MGWEELGNWGWRLVVLIFQFTYHLAITSQHNSGFWHMKFGEDKGKNVRDRRFSSLSAQCILPPPFQANENGLQKEICPVGNSCLVSEDWGACWSIQGQQSKGWGWKISAFPRSKLNVSLSYGSNAPKGERNNLIFFFPP